MRTAFGFAAAALAAASTAAAQPAQGFQTPSRNIACMASGPVADNPAQVRCDVSGMRNRRPRPPEPCGGDYGSAFGVGPTGRGERLCVGDTTADPALRVLAYGADFEAYGVRCVSQPTGVTCRNAEGHGFTVSRGAQRVF